MKPSDFYVGISEFTSILVPGFIVVTGATLFFDLIDFQKELHIYQYAALLIASYLLGHILFVLGGYWDTLYAIVMPKWNMELLKKISNVREKISGERTREIVTYKWCRSVLSVYHPEGYAEFLRKESDSKLFRSLLAPLIFSSAFALKVLGIWWSIKLLLLACIFFWVYRDQRFKATEFSYTHIIVLYQLGKLNKQKR